MIVSLVNPKFNAVTTVLPEKTVKLDSPKKSEIFSHFYLHTISSQTSTATMKIATVQSFMAPKVLNLFIIMYFAGENPLVED